MNYVYDIIFGLFFLIAVIEPIMIPIQLIHDKTHSYKKYLIINLLFIAYSVIYHMVYMNPIGFNFVIISLLALLLTSTLHFLLKNLMIQMVK